MRRDGDYAEAYGSRLLVPVTPSSGTVENGDTRRIFTATVTGRRTMTRVLVSALLAAVWLLPATIAFVGDTTIVAQDKTVAARQPKNRDDARPAVDRFPVRIASGVYTGTNNRGEQAHERRELVLALKVLNDQRWADRPEKRKVLQAGIRDIRRQISELDAQKRQLQRTGNLLPLWIVGANGDERALAVALGRARAHARQLQRGTSGIITVVKPR